MLWLEKAASATRDFKGARRAGHSRSAGEPELQQAESRGEKGDKKKKTFSFYKIYHFNYFFILF